MFRFAFFVAFLISFGISVITKFFSLFIRIIFRFGIRVVNG